MSNLLPLYQLQQADSKLGRLLKEINDLKKDESAHIQVKKLKAEKEELKVSLQQRKSEHKELEYMEADLRAKKDKLHNKLYGGKTFSTKELTLCQNEMKKTEDKMSQVSDQLVRSLETITDIEKKIETIDKNLITAERDAEQAQNKINREINRKILNAREFKAQRDQLAKDVKPDLLKRFMEMKKTKGVVVVRITAGCCDGCHVHLTEHKIQETKSDSVVTCPTCGRILFSGR